MSVLRKLIKKQEKKPLGKATNMDLRLEMVCGKLPDNLKEACYRGFYEGFSFAVESMSKKGITEEK